MKPAKIPVIKFAFLLALSLTAINLFAAIEITKIQKSSENECNGRIDLTATGTAGPFTFLWNNGATSEDLDNLCPGDYMVTVTNVFGCETVLSTSIGICYMTVTPQITSATGPLAPDGALTLVITNETAPVTIEWGHGPTTEGISGLLPGVYPVTITDESCGAIELEFVVPYECNGPELLLSVTHACANAPGTGAIETNITGGTPPYTYSWSNGETSSSVSGLLAGSTTYVTVTDAKGCEAINFGTIFDLPAPSVTGVIEPSSCAGAADGKITAYASGASGPYDYIWNTGQTGNILSDLDIGTYCVTVTAQNGCQAAKCFSTFPETSQVERPYVKRLKVEAINVNTNATAMIYSAEWFTSNNGCLYLTGGMVESTQSYVFDEMEQGLRKLRISAWVNKPMASLDLYIPNQTFSISGTPPSTSQGPFELEIGESEIPLYFTSSEGFNLPFVFNGNDLESSSNGLIDLRTASASFAQCVQPPMLQADCTWLPVIEENGQFDDVHILSRSCLDVSLTADYAQNKLTANVQGGTGPFVYHWELVGATGYAFADVAVISPPEPGTYKVVVRDQNGCEGTAEIIYCLSTTGLKALVLQDAFITPSCPNGATGSICLSDKIPMNIGWDTGAAGSCLDNLTDGTYCAVLTELVCNQTFQVCFEVPDIPGLSVIKASNLPPCPDEENGKVCLSVSGGMPPYQYIWDNGGTLACNNFLASGACHGVTVSDACGQVVSECFSPAPYQTMQVTGSASGSCPDAASGSISVTVTNGRPPYQFSWSYPEGNLNWTTSESYVSELNPGSYYLTVTDACGETVVADEIGVPELSGSFNSQYWGAKITPSCPGENAGAIDNSFSFPSTLDFQWSTGAATEDITSLPPGQYSLTVTGAGGCSAIFQFNVPETTINVQADVVNTCNGTNGAIDLNAAGQFLEGPLTYLWSNGAVTQDISGINSGTYCVTVSDGHCLEELCFEVGFGGDPAFSIDAQVSPTCDVSAVGEIQLELLGLYSAPVAYTWANGSTGNHIEHLIAGEYCVTATDASGCMVEDCIQLGSLFSNIQIITDNIHHVFGGPGTAAPTGEIDISVSGSFPPFQIAWSTGETTEDISGLSAGYYFVTITDAQGCSLAKTYEIEFCNTEAPIVAVENITPLDAPGGGMIDISVTGNAPFSYHWEGPGNFTAEEEDLSGLTLMGQYCVTVTDFCGNQSVICRQMANCPIIERLLIDAVNNCLEPSDGNSYLRFSGIVAENTVFDFITVDLNFSTGETGKVRLKKSEIYANRYYFFQLLDGVREIMIDQEISGVRAVTVSDEFGCSSVTGTAGFDNPGLRPVAQFRGTPYGPAISELYYCCTCGLNFDGDAISYFCHDVCELSGNSSGFHKQIAFNSAVGAGGGNPCQAGGTIFIGTTPPYYIPIPPNALGIFMEGPDEEDCGCLFPPGFVQFPFPVIVGSNLYPNYIEEFVFAKLDPEYCSPSGPDPDPCQTHFEINGETHYCSDYECACCYVKKGTQACTYDLICAETNEVIEENIEGNKILCIYQCPFSYNGVPMCEPGDFEFKLIEICEETCEILNILDDYLGPVPSPTYERCPCLTPQAIIPDGNDIPFAEKNAVADMSALTPMGRDMKKGDIKIYPNPFKDQLNFEINVEQDSEIGIQLFNLLGIPEYDQSFNLNAGENHFRIDLDSSLPQGVYHIVVNVDNGSQSFLFIKMD